MSLGGYQDLDQQRTAPDDPFEYLGCCNCYRDFASHGLKPSRWKKTPTSFWLLDCGHVVRLSISLYRKRNGLFEIKRWDSHLDPGPDHLICSFCLTIWFAPSAWSFILDSMGRVVLVQKSCAICLGYKTGKPFPLEPWPHFGWWYFRNLAILFLQDSLTRTMSINVPCAHVNLRIRPSTSYEPIDQFIHQSPIFYFLNKS